MAPTDAPASTPPNAPPPPPPGGRPSARELRRRPDDGKVAGVCAGLADYFDLDPLVVRIGAIALALAGPGIVIYVLAWIFVPATEGPRLHPQRVTSRTDRNKQILGIVLVVFALSILWGDWWSPLRHWVVPIGLVAVGAWLLLRRDEDDEPLPLLPVIPAVAPPPPAATVRVADPLLGDPLIDPMVDPTVTDPTATDATVADGEADLGAGGSWPGDPTAPPPWSPTPLPPIAAEPPDPERVRRRRRRRMIPGVVMGALLVWGGVAALVGISLQTGLAVALCIIGVGLIVGAVFGGSWVLLIPAALVAFGLMVTSVIDVPLEGPIGHHEHTPQRLSDLDHPYQVSIGELDLDLRELTRPEEYKVDATVGVGHLVVTVPEDATVELTTDVGTGGTRVFGVEDGGVGVSNHHTYEPPSGEDGQTITLHLEVGVGQVDVERAAGSPSDASQLG